MSGHSRLWLLDASIYIFRAWFSLPDRWHSPDGMPLNAVHGYSGTLLQIIRRLPPGDLLVAAFDESLGSCFRNEIYPHYKCSRVLPDEGLAFQLAQCRELTGRAGIACYAGARYEADDYLASLARLARAEGRAVTVISRDKDLGQLLLGEQDHWWDAAADRLVLRADFFEQFGVWPEQFADYLALVGDSIDDIPGVPGIGPKTASCLLQAMGSLAAMGTRLDELAGLPVRGAGRLPALLRAHWEQLGIARQLTALEEAIPDVSALPETTAGPATMAAVADHLEALGLAGAPAGRWRSLAAELAA